MRVDREKRINDQAYQVILRKKREREHEGKASSFRLGETEIEDSKIIRFQKRRKIADADEIDYVRKVKSARLSSHKVR